MLYPFELRALVIDNTAAAAARGLILYQPAQGFLATAEDRKVPPGELFYLVVELARQAEGADHRRFFYERLIKHCRLFDRPQRRRIKRTSLKIRKYQERTAWLDGYDIRNPARRFLHLAGAAFR